MAVTVLTQDWHCSDHVSFAAEHPGRTPYEEIILRYTESGNLCNSTCNAAHNVTQMLWPIHCVINTTSAEFSTSLTRETEDIVVRKGYNCDVDSYSGFFDNGGFSTTELDDVLRSRDIRRVIVTGLALDYCVYYTCMDAVSLGYETFFVEDASRPVANSSAAKALTDMRNSGVQFIQSEDLGTIFTTSSADIINKPLCMTLYIFMSVMIIVLDLTLDKML